MSCDRDRTTVLATRGFTKGAQFLRHGCDRRIPVPRILRERTLHDHVRFSESWSALELGRLFVRDGMQHVDDRFPGKRRPTRKHLEQDGACGEDVGAGVDLRASYLFGRHVLRRSHDHASLTQRTGRLVDRVGD